MNAILLFLTPFFVFLLVINGATLGRYRNPRLAGLNFGAAAFIICLAVAYYVSPLIP